MTVRPRRNRHGRAAAVRATPRRLAPLPTVPTDLNRSWSQSEMAAGLGIRPRTLRGWKDCPKEIVWPRAESRRPTVKYNPLKVFKWRDEQGSPPTERGRA